MDEKIKMTQIDEIENKRRSGAEMVFGEALK